MIVYFILFFFDTGVLSKNNTNTMFISFLAPLARAVINLYRRAALVDRGC